MRHRGYRAYFVLSALVMMADSIEHVISYWGIFQKFHSPALGGFAVISHWLPYLLFSVGSGALADRSAEQTSELQSLMRISYAVFCLKTKTAYTTHTCPQHTFHRCYHHAIIN